LKPSVPLHVAVVGAGMAGVVCARTLAQAGHRVTLIDKARGPGGRMSTRHTEFGDFDHGAQYFTVRDQRFARALENAQHIVRPWSANTVRVLDELGHVLVSAPPPKEPHYVAKPGMSSLLKHWVQPLADGSAAADARVLFNARVTRIERDALNPEQWQLGMEDADGAQQVLGTFDRVVLAMPHPQAHDLLRSAGLAPNLRKALTTVDVAPCWTLMVAFPQASQPGLPHLGPQWNAARSTHHRISWLARESAKHLEDDAERVKAKMIKGFAEITGIRAEPSWSQVHRWRFAQTSTPLGQPFLFDAALGVGACGDWCLGHRVEDAFVSGLEMALALK
jgi:predicted NAD/FAD-dependent oxidoreductase